MAQDENALQWYAFRMRGHVPNESQRVAHEAGFDTYYALQRELKDASYDIPAEQAICTRAVLPSIIFVRCTCEFARQMRNHRVMWPMCMPGTSEFAAISEREIEIFRAAVESGCRNLEVIDTNLATGQRVRVLDGIFKDQEGYIVKIRGDKRFVVSIPGVVALATIYIPPHLLTRV